MLDFDHDENCFTKYDYYIKQINSVELEEFYFKFLYRKIFFTFQVERASGCEFLLIHGEEDAMMPGQFHLNKQIERFKKFNQTNYEALLLPGAGHLLEIPHTPLSKTPFHKLFSK